MKKKPLLNIFQNKYRSLFSDFGYGVNSISAILHGLGYNLKNLDSSIGKIEALDTISQMLYMDLIYVEHWGKYHDLIKDLNLSLNQTLIFLDKIWFENANYTDFIEMVSFKYTDWYYQKLKEIGVNVNTDWEWFGNEFVENMEQWIEVNRPNNKEFGG